MAVIQQGATTVAPAVLRTLTPADSAFVDNLPAAGAIAGAERVRLTQVRDAAQGVDPRLFDRAVAKLAQA